MKKLEIYIHIPFCVKKCAYCDFLSAPAGMEQQRAYIQTLQQEIKQFQDKQEYHVSSIFFGGGTPSILPAEWIEEIMQLIYSEFQVDMDAEISIECNPGTAGPEKFVRYRAAGINRISFGLQSADNEELKLLGRIHTWEDFLQTYEAAKQAGFTNINIDLMSALPGQTINSWRETLKKVLALQTQHISAYSLIIEEGTPFYERYAEDARRREDGEETEILPSEEAEREMYRLTEELLQDYGMHRYEISNYALPGHVCHHNIGYWDGTEYVGFGLGASSLLGKKGDRSEWVWENAPEGRKVSEKNAVKVNEKNVEVYRMYRMKNTEDMESYLHDFSVDREIDELSLAERMEEFMFLGLRMMQGVSEADFRERFGRDIDEVYGEVLEHHRQIGLLERKEGRIFLSLRGIDVSNAVMAEYLLDE